jgi:hypothetical protein
MTVTPTPVVSRVAVTLEAIADCLCEQIVTDGLPPVCYCGVMPGVLAVADRIGNCGDVCGMAWVRLDQMYPATIVGVPSVDPGNCSKGLALDIEVGILRCFPTEPTDLDLFSSTELQLADAESMVRAVSCCPAIPQMDMVLAPYTPMGPDGGTVGGTVSISMMMF